MKWRKTFALGGGAFVFGFALAQFQQDSLAYHVADLTAIQNKQASVSRDIQSVTQNNVEPRTALQPQVAVGAADFGAEAAHLSALYGNRDYLALQDELARAVAADPTGVLDWVKTLPVFSRAAVTSLVLSLWMAKEPRRAVEWANANYHDFLLSREFLDTCVAIGDLGLAEETVLGLKGFERSSRIQMLAEAWAAKDRDYILNWVATLPSRGVDDQGRVLGFLGVLANWSTTDPMSAAAWIRVNGANDNEKRLMFAAMAQGMIRAGAIDKAEAFFSTEPPSAEYSNAYGDIAGALAATYPERVVDWINRIPDPARRSDRISQPLPELTTSRPDLAANLIVSYALDPNANLPRLIKPIRLWAARDPAAAAAFIDKASRLSDNSREELRHAIAPLIPKS